MSDDLTSCTQRTINSNCSADTDCEDAVTNSECGADGTCECDAGYLVCI